MKEFPIQSGKNFSLIPSEDIMILIVGNGIDSYFKHS
jgi:hypothetical protein